MARSPLLAAQETVKLRLIRADDAPPSNPQNLAFHFGLQDGKQVIDPGVRSADGGFAFDFVLKVKPGADPDHPVFMGPHASGPADDRFVYLSWRPAAGGGYINRIKARLSAITWTQVRAAQAADRPLVADMTGWRPHDGRKQVLWTLE
jgi:hypothetical protein